jgi:hypothetical protein
MPCHVSLCTCRLRLESQASTRGCAVYWLHGTDTLLLMSQ